MRHGLVMRIVAAATIGAVLALLMMPWLGLAYAVIAIGLVIVETRTYAKLSTQSSDPRNRRLMLLATAFACTVFTSPGLLIILQGDIVGLFIGTIFVASCMIVHTNYYGDDRVIATVALVPMALITFASYLAVFQTVQTYEPGRAFMVIGTIPAFTVVIFAVRSMTRQNEGRLRMMMARAEAANIAKSDFLANMSHEIRTPMNGIIAMTDMLQSSELTASQRQFTDIITSSGENLLVIINDILDFSKLESRKLDLDPQPFDLVRIVEEVAGIVSTRAAMEVDVASFVDPALPPSLIGDPVRLRQILLNMAGNAAKFTEEGSLLITVTRGTGDVEPGKIPLCVRVHDTGIGIEAGQVEHMFEKFSQATTGTTKLYGGTGLGLAICKDLVELMDGSVFAQSELGKGSTFGFDVALEPASSALNPTVRPSLAGRSVGVLTRSYALHWSLHSQLARHGAQVLPWSMPRVALGTMLDGMKDGRVPDLIVVDGRLTTAKGLSIAAWLAERPRSQRPNLLVLGDAPQGCDESVSAISLPVRAADLSDAVGALIGAKPATSATLAA